MKTNPIKLLLLFLLCCLSAACNNEPQTASPLPTISKITELLEISIPESSEVTFFQDDSGLNKYYRVVLKMPHTSFLTWLKEFQLTPENFGDRHNHRFTTNTDWGATEEPNLLTEQITFSNSSETLNLGYAPTQDNNTTTVYIIYHSR